MKKLSDGKPKFRTVLARAATNTVNLVVAGVGAVGAAAVSSWAVAAIGGAAYVSMVALDSASPSFWKKVFGGGTGKKPKLDPSKIVDAQARRAVEQILASKKELAKVLLETPDDVKLHLGGTIAGVDELELRAATLVTRAIDLESYLKTIKKQPIFDEITELERKAKAATDPTVAREYRSAIEARMGQLKTIEAIESARDRLDANLQRIAATLAGLPANVVRMRALDAQAMDDLSGDVNAELDRMNTDMKTFEDTLKSLAEIKAA
jgi:hypothetical protein